MKEFHRYFNSFCVKKKKHGKHRNKSNVIPTVDDRDAISMLHHLSANSASAAAASRAKKLQSRQVEIPAGGSKTLRCAGDDEVSCVCVCV